MRDEGAEVGFRDGAWGEESTRTVGNLEKELHIPSDTFTVILSVRKNHQRSLRLSPSLEMNPTGLHFYSKNSTPMAAWVVNPRM